MFGGLRFALAVVVVLSHVGVNPGGIWIGVSAVCGFFMVSGFAMTGLISSRFAGGQAAGTFFLERFIRLAPQYYLWLGISTLLAVLGWHAVEWSGFWPYGMFAYVAVIPLGLQTHLLPVNTLIMPQATTLGIEAAFYLVSPWVLRSRWMSWACASISLALILASNYEAIPANLYTYYAAPGPMALYILGSFIFKKDWVSVRLLSFTLVVLLSTSPSTGFNNAWLFGLAFCLPLVLFLSSREGGKWDRALGDASYGCFLGHLAVISLFGRIVGHPPQSFIEQATIVVVSCCLGYLSFLLVERPTIRFRRSLSDKNRYRFEQTVGVST